MATVPVPSARITINRTYSGINLYRFKTAEAMENFFSRLYAASMPWESDKASIAINSVISCFYLPCRIDGGLETTQIGVGTEIFDNQQVYEISSTRFYKFTEGTISIPRKYNNYLDFSPYTRCVIHLPFIGDREIDITPFRQHSTAEHQIIKVAWQVDVATGCCVCYLSDYSGDLYYTFAGNCSIPFPISGADYSRQNAATISAISTGVIGLAAGGAAAVGAYVSAAGSLLESAKPPQTVMSGNLTANSGYMGCLYTYVTLTYPNYDSGFFNASLVGKPCHKNVLLSAVSGFTQIDRVHLTGIPCQKNELDEIDALLKEGIIL